MFIHCLFRDLHIVFIRVCYLVLMPSQLKAPQLSRGLPTRKKFLELLPHEWMNEWNVQISMQIKEKMKNGTNKAVPFCEFGWLSFIGHFLCVYFVWFQLVKFFTLLFLHVTDLVMSHHLLDGALVSAFQSISYDFIMAFFLCIYPVWLINQ